MAVRSKRPYLIRALNDWINDSGLTPYLMVDASGEDVRVPEGYVSSGKMVLNISPSAVRDLVLGDDAISFSARFGGQPFAVYVPVQYVIAIYANESSEGMMFDGEGGESGDTSERAQLEGDDGDGDDEPPKPGGHLKVIK